MFLPGSPRLHGSDTGRNLFWLPDSETTHHFRDLQAELQTYSAKGGSSLASQDPGNFELQPLLALGYLYPLLARVHTRVV